MATPELILTATLATVPVNRAAELEALQQLIAMAMHQARSIGGNSAQSGTVNLPGVVVNGSPGAAAGSCTWAYTPNASL